MGKWSSILFEQNPQLQKRQEIIFDHAGDSGVQSLKTKTKIQKRQEIIFDHAGDSGVQSTWMGSGDEAHQGVPIWQRQQRVTRII